MALPEPIIVTYPHNLIQEFIKIFTIIDSNRKSNLPYHTLSHHNLILSVLPSTKMDKQINIHLASIT